MGLRLLIATAFAAATPVGFLQAHQAPTGAFAVTTTRRITLNGATRIDDLGISTYRRSREF